MIPQQLKIDGINFVLLESKGKKPLHNGWQNKQVGYNCEELKKHLEHGGNYGVRGGGEKHLVVVDFDNEYVQNEVVPKMPKTFTVKAGRGFLHKYFFTNKNESFKIFDESMNTLVDVQAEGKQVVGPGSTHPNGNKYEVVEDMEIAFIEYAELKALLMPYDKKQRKIYVLEKEQRPVEYDKDDIIDRVKEKYRMPNLLSDIGIDISKNPTQCPFHSSKGGKCLGFTDYVAHCFHCDGKWNVFTMVMQEQGGDFKNALEYVAEKAGMRQELEDGRKRYFEAKKKVVPVVSEVVDKQSLKRQFLDLVYCKHPDIPTATEILAQHLLRHNHIYTIKDDTKSEMWIYKEGIYLPQGRSEIRSQLRDILEENYTIFHVGMVLAKIESSTFIGIDDFFGKNIIEEIPVANGILNLLTRELTPFTPKKIFFNKLPVEYIPTATCPMIDKFLTDVLSNAEDKNLFYEMAGFCLWKEYKFEKAFMLVGGGRNGKDKSLELIKRLIGIENCCSVPLAHILPGSFIISEFHNKMANLAGEISNHDLKDASAFKALTGRSLQSAPRKFLSPITFVNHAKFIFACNELPMVYENNRGFWDRWEVLEYPFTFVGKNEYESALDRAKIKIRDESIIDKITTPGELSGFLNASLDGFDRLFKSRSFSCTKGSDEVKQIWIRKSNSVIAFCITEVEDNYEGRISKKEFRKRYTEYCKNHKVSVKTDFVIKKALEELFGASESTIVDPNDSYQRLRIWDGIKWKNSF